MTWCVFVSFFYFFGFTLGKCLSFLCPYAIHSLTVKPTGGLRSVRSALQESDPLIYRPLIRLALWSFYWANDEFFPSFCVSVFGGPSPPFPLSNLVSVLSPSAAPSITTPCTQVMMQFMGSTLLPHITTGAPLQDLFELRAHCGLNII